VVPVGHCQHTVSSSNGAWPRQPASVSGFASSSSAARGRYDADAQDKFTVPPAFEEMLAELRRLSGPLGGLRAFQHGLPRIEGKVKACDFRRYYTDFEYTYLTVLGFARLQLVREEVIRLNNGGFFLENPGVLFLEDLTGMTMHAEREGANHLLRTAPGLMLEAYALAKSDRGGTLRFFLEAFDRNADPCLEGRVGRILDYIQSRSKALSPQTGEPPFEDLAIRPLPLSASAEMFIGEHLRVFVNECTWRWAKARGVDYATAVADRGDDASPGFSDFSAMCNAATFEAALLSRGLVGDASSSGRWEVQLEDGLWKPLQAEQNEALERAALAGASECELTIGSWAYVADLRRMVQRNKETWRERPLRRAPRLGAGGLSRRDVEAAIGNFVRLQTLLPAPQAPRRNHGVLGELAGLADEHAAPPQPALAADGCATEVGGAANEQVDQPSSILVAACSMDCGPPTGGEASAKLAPMHDDWQDSGCPHEDLRDTAAPAALWAGAGMPPAAACSGDGAREGETMRDGSPPGGIFEAVLPSQPIEGPGVIARGSGSACSSH